MNPKSQSGIKSIFLHNGAHGIARHFHKLFASLAQECLTSLCGLFHNGDHAFVPFNNASIAGLTAVSNIFFKSALL
jgi:hypothetical protein